MIDTDGDENYQPMLIPMEGGFPEPAFGGRFAGDRVHLEKLDDERGIVYLGAESRKESVQVAWRGNLATGEVRELGRSAYGCAVAGVAEDHRTAVLVDGYALGDHVLYLWEESKPGRRLLYGTPLEARRPGERVPLNAIAHPHFTAGGRGLLFTTALFSDTYGLGWLVFDFDI